MKSFAGAWLNRLAAQECAQLVHDMGAIARRCGRVAAAIARPVVGEHRGVFADYAKYLVPAVHGSTETILEYHYRRAAFDQRVLDVPLVNRRNVDSGQAGATRKENEQEQWNLQNEILHRQSLA